MGNLQLKVQQNCSHNIKTKTVHQATLNKRAKFTYIDPIKFDIEEIPHIQYSIPEKKNENNLSLKTNLNRSLDQFHRCFQTVKVKWNQFIKLKKRNFFVDYDVVYEIGQGCYGSVFKVKAIHTGNFRAAKKIYKNLLTHGLQQRLFEQIGIMMNLDHPNINKILQVYDQADFYIILMELCEGGQLFNKIVAKNLNQSSAAAIMKQIFRALLYIHTKNIVHRDIKPQNMLFQKGSNLIKIIDFGIATKISSQKLSQRLGTPYYIAPQVLLKKYDQKCDVWSCGIILYMIIFGAPPFSGKDQVDIMKNILKNPINFQGPKWKKLSPLGKDFIQGLLQKDPKNRYSSQQAFNHPWILNSQQVYDNQSQNSPNNNYIQNLCRFHFKNKIEAVVLTYIVSQALSSTQKLPLLKNFIESDTNHDGVLSFEQVKNLIQSKSPQLYKSLKLETVQKLLRSMDLNNSGQIDFTQFLVATINRKQIKRQHYETAFSYFDIDHNGVITFSQILQFLQNSNETVSKLKKMFEKADQNHDGQISKEQFFKLASRK